MGYIVAFRNTKETGAYEGVITWTCFENKEKFDAWFTKDLREKYQVVDEDISEEEAVELVRKTPLTCRIAVSIDEDLKLLGAVPPSMN